MDRRLNIRLSSKELEALRLRHQSYRLVGRCRFSSSPQFFTTTMLGGSIVWDGSITVKRDWKAARAWLAARLK